MLYRFKGEIKNNSKYQDISDGLMKQYLNYVQRLITVMRGADSWLDISSDANDKTDLSENYVWKRGFSQIFDAITVLLKFRFSF